MKSSILFLLCIVCCPAFPALTMPPHVTRDEVDQAIQKAFKVWSDVAPLTFTRIYDGVSDIEMLFASKVHKDFLPFDGPSGVLAHAFAPGDNIGGDVHFDADEKWTSGSASKNLFHVAAHELGHSLGLDHSNDRNLSQDDINGIHFLYRPKEVTVVPTKSSISINCQESVSFDAVTTLCGDILYSIIYFLYYMLDFQKM
ncbi:hypothetical protein XELAEV_18016260mg [Xenopus laevis]|uniref:Peptidase metallopeptidase domain-containing protein n=1 Tax=Xenopus laevis TaxID=8355 RepID=A0A974DL45_XENLA|nr:hypothetical protein XELAEV_18016260mg [Xenopus laevis]